MTQKKHMRDTALQYAKAVLCAALTVVLLVLLVVEMIPEKSVGVQVKDEIYVASSPIYAGGSVCTTHVRGIVKNTSTQSVNIESIRVVIGNGAVKKDVEVSGVLLAPGSEYDVDLDIESDGEYDTVHDVFLRVDGTESRLTNRAVSEFPMSGLAIGCLALLIPAVYLLVRSIQGCYYLYQEKKIDKKSL
jgi:hypothetical protein